jgi:cyanophycin synthetase
VELASDKEETNKILGSLGLPVPRQELVQTASADAIAARSAGRPGGDQAVQRQPRPRHHHQRQRADEVRAGFEAAREHSRSVIVETYLAGDDHRLLVVNGELVAATRRTPGHVVGDGARRRELVEIVNRIRAAASATRRC